jgi:hypothetical protein
LTCPRRYPAALRSWLYRVQAVQLPRSGGVLSVGNRRDIAFLSVFRRFRGVLPFRRVFGRVFCSVRSAASVRKIDGAPISCIYLGSVHNSRWDALQPAGRAETVTADICSAGRRKCRHAAHHAARRHENSPDCSGLIIILPTSEYCPISSCFQKSQPLHSK